MDKVGGEEWEGEMYGESNMEIYNTICKIDSQWEFAVWLRELKLKLCNNQEGLDRVGGGRESRDRGDMDVPMADSCWHKTKKTQNSVIILQLKLIKRKKEMIADNFSNLWDLYI